MYFAQCFPFIINNVFWGLQVLWMVLTDILDQF